MSKRKPYIPLWLAIVFIPMIPVVVACMVVGFYAMFVVECSREVLALCLSLMSRKGGR